MVRMNYLWVNFEGQFRHKLFSVYPWRWRMLWQPTTAPHILNRHIHIWICSSETTESENDPFVFNLVSKARELTSEYIHVMWLLPLRIRWEYRQDAMRRVASQRAMFCGKELCFFDSAIAATNLHAARAVYFRQSLKPGRPSQIIRGALLDVDYAST